MTETYHGGDQDKQDNSEDVGMRSRGKLSQLALMALVGCALVCGGCGKRNGQEPPWSLAYGILSDAAAVTAKDKKGYFASLALDDLSKAYAREEARKAAIEAGRETGRALGEALRENQIHHPQVQREGSTDRIVHIKNSDGSIDIVYFKGNSMHNVKIMYLSPKGNLIETEKKGYKKVYTYEDPDYNWRSMIIDTKRTRIR